MTDANAESLRVWDSVSGGWKRHRALLFEAQRDVSERLVSAMPATDGTTILELTAGPGETGMLLAERAPSTNVIVSDFAPGMLDAARDEVARRGYKNVEIRRIDAQSIDLPDASVDGVVSRYGLMLVPDRAKAFGEIHRVLRHGGTLAYAVWGPIEANPWAMVLGAVLIQTGHFTPPEGGPPPLSTLEDNRAELERAGFSSIETEYVDVSTNFDDFDQYFALMSEVAGPLALILSSLSDSDTMQVRAQLQPFTQSFATPDGHMQFPSRTIFVRAKR